MWKKSIMVKSSDLDEFCLALVAALSAMRKANELPAYLTGKAREVNAFNAQESFLGAMSGEGLKQFLNVSAKMRICSKEEFRSKEDILRELNEVKPLLDRIKHGSYKLILDRFIAAHELALHLSEVVDEILAHDKSQIMATEKKRVNSF